MIAETSILGASPWHSEGFFSKDYLPSHDVCLLPEEWKTSYTQTQTIVQERKIASAWSTLNSISCETSITESECSDDVLVDIESDMDENNGLLLSDNVLSPPMMSLLGDAEDGAPLTTFDWADSGVHSQEPLPSTNEDNKSNETQTTSPNKRGKVTSKSLNDSKSWSSMPQREQLTTIKEISQIISEEMGLREQLEVIRIINPQADVSPTDTEFVIEITRLNDDKLTQIRELIRQHALSKLLLDIRNTSSPMTKTYTKRSVSQERKVRQRLQRQRQRKEQRQMKKEKQSGLFAKEEVLSLSNCDPSNGEDVDIC